MMNTTEPNIDVRSPTRSDRLRLIETAIGLPVVIFALLTARIVHDGGASFWYTVVATVLSWLFLAHAGAFKVAISMRDRQVVSTVAVASLAGLVLTALGGLLGSHPQHSLTHFLISGLVAFSTLSVGVLVARRIIRSLWLRGSLRTTAVVVGNEFTTHELMLELQDHQHLGIDVVGEVDTTNDGSLARLVADTCPDRVIIAGNSTIADIELAATLSDSPARVYIMPQQVVAESTSAWFAQHQINGLPIVRVDRKSRPLYERIVAPARSVVSGI